LRRQAEETEGQRQVRNLGKPVALAERYYEERNLLSESSLPASASKRAFRFRCFALCALDTPMTLKPGRNRQNTFKTKLLTEFVNTGIKKCVYFADTGIISGITIS
jgi:hypothetical protein